MMTTTEKLKKGTMITVQHYIGEEAKQFLLFRGNDTYQLLCDAVVLGEKVYYGSASFVHVWQIHEDRLGEELRRDVRFWPRLRIALMKYGEKPFLIPADSQPMHYADEFVIADFAENYNGFEKKYFLVKRSDVTKFLLALPLDEAGEQTRREHELKREEESFEEDLKEQLEAGTIVKDGWDVRFRA